MCLVTLTWYGLAGLVPLAVMDNLTHSLVGLIAGESIARTTPARQPGLPPATRRGLFVVLSIIGGNLPDLDLLYSFRGFSQSDPDKLLYMLHHRGYTHTVVGCLVLALLLYGAAEVWAGLQRITLTPRDRGELAGIASFATGLHLGMDFLNSYGIHPFWPWRDQWVYGDSVFIVEPLYWAAAAPLLFVVRTWAARIILGLVILAAVALSVGSPLVPAFARVVFLVVTVALLAVGSRVSPRTAALVGAGAMVLITATFVAAGQVATHRIESVAAAESGSGRIIDHVLTPLPMNPLCWDALLLVTDGDRYRVRHGMLADAPALLPAAQCPILSGERAGTAPMVAAAAPDSAQIRWLGEFDMSRARLAAIVAAHCEAAALMQFARAPFAAELDRQWVMGDLRFDRARGSGMSTIELGPSAHGTCRTSVPWIPPRLDLLRGAEPLRLP
jgi:inner membrane protein